MRPNRRRFGALRWGLAGGLVTAFGCGDVPNDAPRCRPSAAAAAASQHPGPTVLMVGNSQIFDGAWDLGDALTVNCGVQGLTAAAASGLVASLPEVHPDAVVLGFGAVEAIRHGEGVDVAAFTSTYGRVLDEYRERWPRARLLLSAVPPMRKDRLRPSAQGAAEAVAPLNAAIEALCDPHNATFVTAPFPTDAGGLAADMTHDGVHITPAGYRLWSQHLRASLKLQ